MTMPTARSTAFGHHSTISFRLHRLSEETDSPAPSGVRGIPGNYVYNHSRPSFFVSASQRKIRASFVGARVE
jgi:hypothetical protein